MTKSSVVLKPIPKQNNLFGISMMLLHVVALSALYAAVKALVQDLNSNLVVFMYKLSILVLIIPWCLKGGIKTMKTDRLGLHFIRGFLSICGSLCMFYAIKHITLADISAVQYMEHIVLLVIGILYFKEKSSKTKIGVIIFSFIGALIVIRPDFFPWIADLLGQKQVGLQSKGFNSYYVFVFLALTFWAMNSTAVKILGKTEKTKAQLFYTTLFSCMLSLPIAGMHWETYTTIAGLEVKYPVRILEFSELGLKLKHIEVIVLLGLLYLTHAITHFKALKHAELSVVVPLEYTRLVFTAMFGYLMFKETPALVSYVGYAVIISAGLFLVHSERKKYKRRKMRQEVTEEYAQ